MKRSSTVKPKPKCEICNVVFRTTPAWAKHMKKHRLAKNKDHF